MLHEWGEISRLRALGFFKFTKGVEMLVQYLVQLRGNLVLLCGYQNGTEKTCRLKQSKNGRSGCRTENKLYRKKRISNTS